MPSTQLNEAFQEKRSAQLNQQERCRLLRSAHASKLDTWADAKASLMEEAHG